jgi:hypothetical protein
LLLQRTNGRLEVWNETASRRERVLPGDESYVWPPVGNAQGTLVARQRSGGSIVLADLSTGTALDTFPSPATSSYFKTGIGFSPDGTRLITVTDEETYGTGAQLVQRDLSDDALVRTACATAGRNLTAAEWKTFVGTKPPANLTCR